MAFTEKQKMLRCMLHTPEVQEIMDDLSITRKLCHEFNMLRPSETEARKKLIRRILPNAGEGLEAASPFWCFFGYNIKVGRNLRISSGFTAIDCVSITFGDNVTIGENVGFNPPMHPADRKKRDAGLAYGLPITVGSDVYIGQGTEVVAGARIGSNVIIGAGSVVVGTIHNNCYAAGNPCRVIRRLSGGGTAMTEQDKMLRCALHSAYDAQLAADRLKAADLCFELNTARPSDIVKQKEILSELLPNVPPDCVITPPFRCEYGCNVHAGRKFLANHGLTVLDSANVTFGNNVLIGPDCIFSTSAIPADTATRNEGKFYALPITVGDSVWFGAGVRVNPGVTIGSNVIIGAGSVVTVDIPNDCVAVGNPCRVSRRLPEQN